MIAILSYTQCSQEQSSSLLFHSLWPWFPVPLWLCPWISCSTFAHFDLHDHWQDGTQWIPCTGLASKLFFTFSFVRAFVWSTSFLSFIKYLNVPWVLSSHRLAGNKDFNTRHESNHLGWSWSQKCDSAVRKKRAKNRSLRETKEVVVKERIQKKWRREQPDDGGLIHEC